MRKFVYIFLLLLTIGPGCSTGNGYRLFHEFPQEVWNRYENPVLEFNISDPGIYYDMYLQVNYLPSHRPENFKVTVIMTTPSGEVRSRDLDLDFEKSVSAGGHNELRVLLRKDYAFAEKGICYFEIENRSSNVNTDGIKSVGIYMESPQ